MSVENESKMSFKDTLNLPRTDFPIRPDHKQDDKKLLERWANDDLYKKTFEANNGKAKYILHDGPPYANGNIHLGHAYNKCLKDFVTKFHRMSGKHTPVTPGWDCHGLPIELRVTKETPGLSRVELRKACRKYAEKWIRVQKEEFKALGVMMDWANPYETMDFGYEASIVRAFGEFVEKGFIEKKNKTVAWCASCETVLASAEIEYQERKDPSIYIKFPLHQEDKNKLFANLKDNEISFLVWTTTPWTLPLNRGVLLKPESKYQVIKFGEEYLIIGASLVDKICAMLEIEKNIVQEIVAEKLSDAKASQPFDGSYVPVILEGFVSLDDGTACVHCAPGCGPEDYEVGVRNNLEIFSPVSVSGKYQKGIKPEELEGVSIQDAQGWVIKTLQENNRLVHKTSIRHSYPHCWRCRNGLIFRATSQWFCNLAKNNLKEKALNALNEIQFLPEHSKNSLKAAVGNRLEWCLSRQRAWGVPIPALLCKNCNFAFLTHNLVNKVAEGVEKEGIEFWDTVEIKSLIDAGFKCSECGASDWIKEQDILDVWFDSGISHYAVLKKNPALAYPADMYLEGRDQARGWFQSSLLTSLVLEGKPSMRSIVTHGYTVDAKGQKMSKSLNNGVSPQELIDSMGTDGLRLWASSIEEDAVVSAQLVGNVQEVYRKIRNTCRFLLSNLYDFDINKDAIELEKLMLIDKYAIYDLKKFNNEILLAYKESRFTAIFHDLTDYCTKNLSAFYLDVIKDRLYVEQSDGFERRAAQTTCWYILDTLTKLMAPILSFTAELVSDEYQRNKEVSIHLQQLNNLSDICEKLKLNLSDADFQREWDLIFKLRSALLKSIEVEREKGLIKHPLEGEIFINYDITKPELVGLFEFILEYQSKAGKTVEDFFEELMVVSKFKIVDLDSDMVQTGFSGVSAKVLRSAGIKCPRCWKYHNSELKDGLCNRCYKIVTK